MTRKTVERRIKKWLNRAGRAGERFDQCWTDLRKSGRRRPTYHWYELKTANAKAMAELLRYDAELVRRYAQRTDPE